MGTVSMRGKPAPMTFTEEVKQVIESEREAALEDVGRVLHDAIVSIVKNLTGATYDRWDRQWKFEEPRYGEPKPLVAALTAKAHELAPTLIEKALEEPISFTQKDLSALRATLKDAVIQAAGEILREQAHDMAEQAIAQMQHNPHTEVADGQ